MNPIDTTFLVLTKDCPTVVTLLDFLVKYKDPQDKILILDDFSTPENLAILKKYPARIIQHKLDGDYSAHRNHALQFLKTKYTFALDDDEIPTLSLMKSYKQAIINMGYPDLILVPRLNLFEGVFPIHALRFNWDLSYIDGKTAINWSRGDFQTRLFKNKRGLYWTNKLHESIFPRKEHVCKMLPKDINYCIEHRKTIVEQISDNERYNANWTVSENKAGGSYDETK